MSFSVRTCNVAGCIYVATGDFEEFAVCDLHDSPVVFAFLEKLQRPGAFWFKDRPIVLPVGDLKEEHFEPFYAAEEFHPIDDPDLAEIDLDGPSPIRPEIDILG